VGAVRTPRLEIRPWRVEDAPTFHRIWGDPDVIFWGPAKDVDESAAMLRRARARCEGHPPPVGWHAILEGDGGEPVGNVVLQPAPFSPGDLEVGWHLRRDRWGRGYATEAARALMDEAFASLPVTRLVCAILPANRRSQEVARRLGFELHARDVLHGGLPHKVWVVHRVAPVG
jgi:RimJ/RimL family protein N-acetyltransferase